MPRLIDADELSKLVGEPIEVFLKRLDLKLPPTVDAIPIEWIENFIDDIGDLEEEMTMRAVYSLLINEWRKEE